MSFQRGRRGQLRSHPLARTERQHDLSTDEIARLLQPFAAHPLTESQLAALARYLELLLRWNARVNLTSIREAKNIVTRHIGEAWFAAERLFSNPAVNLRVIDVGSGAGFPGLPLKVYAPRLRLTLVESQHKKATFLKEAVRVMSLGDTEVFAGRAEEYGGRAEVVTLRAVERFEKILPLAASLLECADEQSGMRMDDSSLPRLALLIGASQVARARELLPGFHWEEPALIPQSNARILLIGTDRVSGRS